MSKVRDYLEGIFEHVKMDGVDSETGEIKFEQITPENAESESKSEPIATKIDSAESKVQSDNKTESKTVAKIEVANPEEKAEPVIESSSEMLEIRQQLAEANAKIDKLTSETTTTEEIANPFNISEPEDIEDFSQLVMDKDAFVSWLKNFVLHTTKPMVDKDVETAFSPVQPMLAQRKLIAKIAGLVQRHNEDFPALMEDFKAVVRENPKELLKDDLDALYWMAKQRQGNRLATTKKAVESETTITKETTMKKEDIDDAVKKSTVERNSSPVQDEKPKVIAKTSRQAAEQAVAEMFG